MSRHITARLALALAIFGSAEFEPHRLRALEPTAKTDSLADRQPVSPGELHVYGNAAGELSYALAMRATDLPQATSTQVVVLVDTSASQTGTYWEDTLAAVKSLGDRLRPSDRVALIAIDVQAVAMSEGFVAPQSDAWKQAFQRLQGRSPLGSTDLLAGLRTVLAQPWKNEASESRSVIYVGDGTSRADIISEQDLRAVTADFVKARITMHSFALGRQTDVALLAVLANHTGGNVFLDGPNVTAAQAGQELARVSQSAVLWPVAAEFPKGLDTRFPSDLPPLRSDRETILVGKLTAATGELLSIQITGECLGEAMPWKWETKVGASEGGYAYLPRLVEMTSRSQGFQFPVLGLRGLQIVQESLLTEASNFGDLAKQAAATGDLEGAERLAVAALKRDPSNRRAQSVREATAVSNSTPQATTEIAPLPTKTAPAATTKSKQPTQGKKKGQANKPGQLKESRSGEASFASPVRWKTVQFTGKQDSNFGGDVIGEQLISPSGDPISGDNFSDDNRVQSTDPDAGRLVDDSVARTRLQTEILTAEVKNAVKNAREQMRSNPEGVLQELKFELDAVRQAIDVNEGVRTRLADDLRRSIQETEHRKVEKDEQDQRLNQAQAVGVERLNLLEAAQQQEERIANLIAKYNRFTDEEDYPRASEVAESAHKLDTDNLTTIAANEVSQFKMNIEHALDVRERRHRAFHLIMDDIEATAIPFVGDPPIVYPDAEKWLQLTKRRKKWKDSVNLAQLGPAEQRIFDRFDDPTEMNYTDTPFSEVVADLENQHEIEIEIDDRALIDLGLSSENMQINRQLSGVSLRSALRLLLNDLDLTYLVRDEVLFITTPEEAQSKLVTKVYPVADIVIPIQSGGMGGGMMGGGMMGGMGGGMMGGGMGGMGGGMGGMGGGMMGG
ncbi:MAG: VWA domain-containing protein, partial [Planctomycetota bacterium]|nr:VWA domain-containing protein [Planctomycetota bacterium]